MKWHFWAIGGFSLVSLPVIFRFPRSAAQGQWQPASQVLSAELQLQIRKENLQPGTPVDIGQMRVLIVQRSPQPFYLIDTRVADAAKGPDVNPLCGADDCLFLGYRANQRVLNIYLNPKLPPNVTLIQPIDQSQAGLPCLRINQLEQQKLHRTKLCFNGNTYEIMETQILPEVYE